MRRVGDGVGSDGRTAAALAMFGAAALWGLSGGVVSGLATGGAAAASAVELTTGVALTVASALRGYPPFAVVAALRWRLLALGAIEAVNVLAYYVALQLAPVGPVMALHLTAPVLLTVIALGRRRRRPTVPAIGALALVCAALVLIAVARPDPGRYPHALLGFVLSLASAGCLALFISLVGLAAADVPPLSAAGAQMLVSGLLLSPALLALRDHPADTGRLVALGLLAFAPACWLYWAAMRRLTPISASTILLAEPFTGALVAIVLYRSIPSAPQALAAVLVLAAVYLDLRQPVPAALPDPAGSGALDG